jgi:hypothetical protein
MSELEILLNKLESTEISSIDFDLLKNKITINVVSVEDETTIEEYRIEFIKVSAFFFVEAPGKNRLEIIDYEPGDYLELTSIGYYKKGIGEISIKNKIEKWVENYRSNFNFGLEIWSSMLLIEAGSIKINGRKFNVIE